MWVAWSPDAQLLMLPPGLSQRVGQAKPNQSEIPIAFFCTSHLGLLCGCITRCLLPTMVNRSKGKPSPRLSRLVLLKTNTCWFSHGAHGRSQVPLIRESTKWLNSNLYVFRIIIPLCFQSVLLWSMYIDTHVHILKNNAQWKLYTVGKRKHRLFLPTRILASFTSLSRYENGIFT